VEEETGFDLTGLINPKDKVQTQISAQTVTMFLVKGIDEKTVFETQTRKEIGVSTSYPYTSDVADRT
jgi:mRNA-decapping enzyme subunit 2